MFNRVYMLLLLLTVSCGLYAKDRTQAELQFVPATSAEKNAGVWVDGHYMGCLKELRGSKRVSLLPGAHEIVVRQAWYQDYVEQTVLEAGAVHIVKPSLVKTARTSTEKPSAELKIAVTPSRAAVFLDGEFAGHVNEFDGPGQAMLVFPGEHKLTVTLPGYVPFETVLNLKPDQKVRISTTLSKGGDRTGGALVSPK